MSSFITGCVADLCWQTTDPLLSDSRFFTALAHTFPPSDMTVKMNITSHTATVIGNCKNSTC